MLEHINDFIRQGKKGKIVALIFVLGFSYSFIWQVLEPWNLEVVDSNRVLWRWILIILTLIVTIITFLILYPRKNLEQFGFDASDTNLQTSMRSTGNPQITISSDGFQGKVFVLKANFHKDEMDWQLKPSANKASSIIFLYSDSIDLKFYLRIRVVSKDKSTQELKWIRLETNISIPDKCINQEEMAYPITADNQDGFLRSYININKAVIETHGQKGWIYDKIILFRIRGSGKIKKITLQ